MSGDSVRVASPLFPVEGQGSIPMSPLQFEIVEVHYKIAKQLNKLWHSQLPIVNSSKICFGAKYKNIWYAVGIFDAPISRAFNDKNYLELKRLAISQDSPKNTASRMIKIMTILIKKQMPEIVKLISYQDTEVHTGTIYKASGWIEIKNKGHKPDWHNRKPSDSKAPLFQKKYPKYFEKIRYKYEKKYIAVGDKIRWEKQIRQGQETKTTVIKPPKKTPQKGLFD